MPTCCVPGCASGYRKDASSSDRHFFYALTDVSLRAAWNKAVPRADKESTATSRVCDLHFHQKDILKTYVHVIDGKSVEIPRGKWSLAKDAVPKVFLNLPAYLSKPPEKKRKPRCKSAKRPTDQASEQRQVHESLSDEKVIALSKKEAREEELRGNSFPVGKSERLQVSWDSLCLLRFYGAGTFQTTTGVLIRIPQSTVCHAVGGVLHPMRLAKSTRFPKGRL
ncbi:hypothetical protein HPB52_006213 [Rhipicephalus sanguineus]|uniref:THAP-type domain-containing protein n=1 Tax=Rhipicephalus sanguineus TaxID=34632 RepID=A0A9D4QHM7_RHISA|nr:hypothetical protein HPB52_006213 [Rhipicephalus sanguineus]